MRQDLRSGRLQISLDTFIQKMELLNKADNSKLVSKIVIKWTQGQTLLTKKLLQYILQSEPRINEGEEASAVEQVIRNRLLKEFKKDNLTLAIRKKLYQKDLENLLEVKEEILQEEDKLFLYKIQKSLGLTNKQAQIINNSKVQFNNYIYNRPNKYLIDYQNNINRLSAKNSDSSLLTKPLDISEQSNLIIQSFTKPEIEHQAKKKSDIIWWLLFWIPLLLLSAKGFDWVKKRTHNSKQQFRFRTTKTLR
ncbi:MAG: hypothetical protein ACFCAD_06855 [Pleurocapsa sp.]